MSRNCNSYSCSGAHAWLTVRPAAVLAVLEEVPVEPWAAPAEVPVEPWGGQAAAVRWAAVVAVVARWVEVRVRQEIRVVCQRESVEAVVEWERWRVVVRRPPARSLLQLTLTSVKNSAACGLPDSRARVAVPARVVEEWVAARWVVLAARWVAAAVRWAVAAVRWAAAAVRWAAAAVRWAAVAARWAVAVARWAVAVVLQPLKEAASTLKSITARTPNFVALVDSR